MTSQETTPESAAATTTEARRKRSRGERDELVAQWSASGKPVPQFAAERGLAPSSLYQWVRSRKDATAKKKANKRKRRSTAAKPKSAFTELRVAGQVSPSATRGPAMTIALRGGHSVTFEGTAVDPTWLKSVLEVVKAC